MGPRPETTRRRRPALAGAACAALCAAGLLRPMPATASDVAWLWPGAVEPSPRPAELAVLVETLLLRPAGVEVRPRRTPVAAGAGTLLTPVVHVQVEGQGDALPADHTRAVVAATLKAARRSTSGWVQLDFEAPGRLRDDYRRLVAEVRGALPASTRLSVTAPGVWCSGGAWLEALAADEVVPMFFAMGAEAAAWRALVRDRPGELHPRCRAGAAGFSADAPPPAAVWRRYARRYWFHERPRQPYTLPPQEASP